MSCISCARCCAAWVGFGIVALSSAANATVIDTQTFSGHTYKLLSASSWQAAQTEAQSLGGNLVTVNNAAENNFILTTFGHQAITAAGANYAGKVNLWLGINDVDVEGTFKWISGLSSSFTDWFDGQPQDHSVDEDFGGIRVRGSNANVPVGHWIDIVSDSRLGDKSFGVVEIVSGSAENPPAPEPGTFILASLGGALLTAQRYWKRRAAI